MSFKFSHNGQNYWAKQTKNKTEVYSLKIKGCANQVLVMAGKPEEDDIAAHLDSISMLLK